MPGRVVVRAGQLSCSCLFKSRCARRIQRRKQQACHLQLVMIHEVDAFRWGAEFNAPGGRVRSIIHANQPLDQPEEDDRGVPFRAEVLHGSLRLGSCAPGRDVLSRPSLACLGSENLALPQCVTVPSVKNTRYKLKITRYRLYGVLHSI
jgi:hypothetical protein